MTDHFGDARLEELTLLSEIERTGSVTETPRTGARRDMIAFLVWERLVNDLHLQWTHDDSEGFSGLPGESLMERKLNHARLQSLSCVLAGKEVRLELTHRGRVRISELKQSLRAGRIRERYGILWDGRHLETDLLIALLDASESTPLSIGFLDMNGLKDINDSVGHEAGSLAVQAYFQAVATALSDQGEAYGVGGDEVIAVLPSQDSAKATSTFSRACRLLMGEQLKYDGSVVPPPSISVGVATITDPRTSLKDLRHRADQAMYRAKARAHQVKPNPSAIAVGEEGDVSVIGFND